MSIFRQCYTSDKKLANLLGVLELLQARGFIRDSSFRCHPVDPLPPTPELCDLINQVVETHDPRVYLQYDKWTAFEIEFDMAAILTENTMDALAPKENRDDGFLQRVLLYQAENDDEFAIKMSLTLTHHPEEYTEYDAKNDNLREILQEALDTGRPVSVRISSHAVATFEVAQLYLGREPTRTNIIDPYIYRGTK